MTSEKSILANQKNAKKSTGPKTEAGKKIVSSNALSHGLTSQSLMHPGVENIEEFQKYTKKIYDCFSPKDDLEVFFVNRAISCMWRLKRVVNIEEAIFSEEIKSDEGNVIEQIFNYLKDKMMLINKYEKSLESSLFKTLREIKKLQER